MPWTKIGVCRDSDCDERLWHAALSTDATKCLVAGFDDCSYVVWDIRSQKVIWRDVGIGRDFLYPSIAEWTDENGYVEIADSIAAGRYRVFGINVNFARSTASTLGQSLSIDLEHKQVLVYQTDSNAMLARLSYESFSGDWAYASFSDNDEVFAVIEPYSVTFYGPKPAI